jgi:sugar lactone lactonase YvrE
MASIAITQVEIFGTGVLRAEGVVIDREGNAWGGGRNGKVYKVSPDGVVHEVAQLPDRAIPNGVTLDRAGNFVYCDLRHKAVMRCTPEGKVSLVADRAGDLPLSIPNFASYDAEGNLYVSNSSSQPGNKVFDEFANPAPNGVVARIRPDGRGEVVATGIYFANGTAIDPNEDAVYVLESSRHDCVRIAIKKDGTFGKPEIYASGFPAIPDGMAFDVERNLYVTLPGIPKDGKLAPKNQLIRIDPNGQWELLVDDPDGTRLAFPTNCAFGGPGLQDLFIANLEGDHFNRIRTSVHGHPLYHQR